MDTSVDDHQEEMIGNDSNVQRRSGLPSSSYLRSRTIKQKSHPPVKGNKKSDDMAINSTSISAFDHCREDLFDSLFLSAVDQLKLLGYEEYAKKTNPSLMPIQEILNKLFRLGCSPGILKDSVCLLKRGLNLNHYCSLSVDIHPIQEMIQFENETEFFLGCVSPLSTELKLASEMVVFLLRGLEEDWKGVVGYMLVCYKEDLWAIWHTLFKVVQYLLASNLVVVNVSLSKTFGFDVLEKISHMDLQAGAFIKNPFDGLDFLCFTMNVDELLKDLSKCIVLYNINLTSLILEKYNLVHESLNHENLRLFFEDKILSSDSIFSWFLSWKSNCESVDLSSISHQSETFFMHMMGKWSSIMRTCLETDSLGSHCTATNAHLQFLNEIVWIVQSLEEMEKYPDLLLLWGNIRKTTTSVLALHDNYVSKGALTCLKTDLLKNLTLHNLNSVMPIDVNRKPTPLTLLRYIQLVNAAILFAPNLRKVNFQKGCFLKQFLKHCKMYIPSEDSTVPDMNGCGLYLLSSHIVSKMLSKSECEKCRASLTAKTVSKDLPLQWIEAVEGRGLDHPSLSVYDTLQWAESHLINTEEDIFKLHKAKCQLAFRVFGEMAFSIRSTFPSCHDTLRSMLSLFMDIRLQMMAEDLSRNLRV